MANRKQLKILKQGVDVWNNWREENPRASIDLSETNLKEVKLSNANLSGAVLSGSNLSSAILVHANLRVASLIETNLSEANLFEADLTTADLERADLTRANLFQANLRGAYLTETRFLRTQLISTIFGYNDLSQAIDIDKADHKGRSTIGVDTIYKSKGKIPEIFLRGCGLSDLDIEYSKLANPGLDPEQVTDVTYKIHQLYVGGGIHYYSCFISYNSKDEGFARQLHDDLQNNGVRCWFAPEDIKIGDQIRPTIDRQIRLRDKLLVILSHNSIQSEWVGDEVEATLEEEAKSNRSVLFPIRLDDTVMNTRDDWTAKIKRRRHIGDFSKWNDKSRYQKAFEWLLRDLKATGEKT